ncbi:MAG: helix-turn-helix transcriptional regulator [Pseudomonadota bacterium]
MLTFEGQIIEDGRYWLVAIPALNLATQGRSKREAYRMARNVVIDASGNDRLEVTLMKGPGNTFLLTSSDLETLIPLLLKKQRQKAGLSVAQASRRLGSNSSNAYGVYEYGRARPTLRKLEQLLRAINPAHRVTLKCA